MENEDSTLNLPDSITLRVIFPITLTTHEIIILINCYRLDFTLPMSLHCLIVLVLFLCSFGHCFLPLSIVLFHCPLSPSIVHCLLPLSLVPFHCPLFPLSLLSHSPIVLLYFLYIFP